jgi:hypothetical protein
MGRSMTDSSEYLTRKEASEYLQARGLPISYATLHKYAAFGGGPAYCIIGRHAVYRRDELTAWIEAKLAIRSPHTSGIHRGKVAP